MNKTSNVIKKFYTKCRYHKSNDISVEFSDDEIYLLLYLSFKYLGWSLTEAEMVQVNLPTEDYFKLPLSYFSEVTIDSASKEEVIRLIEYGFSKHLDFQLFFDNFRTLHQKRSKYKRILSTQTLPSMEQIGPRVLLEYGEANLDLLANWMLWRKWIYDIDNRSAQETGYVFEPVLAGCLGGESYSSSKSPIKRIKSDGSVSAKGRQADCIEEGSKKAYEFKLRVTIAASGQGRFGEELSFPFEANSAGYKPILLVLDETPSNRLTELSNKFIECGGEVYVGSKAWKLIEDEAGDIMSAYVEKLIKPALDAIDNTDITELNNINLSWSKDKVTISSGTEEYEIHRTEKC
jgi:hypothetical protein